MLEQHEECAVQHARFTTLETIAPFSDDPRVSLAANALRLIGELPKVLLPFLTRAASRRQDIPARHPRCDEMLRLANAVGCARSFFLTAAETEIWGDSGALAPPDRSGALGTELAWSSSLTNSFSIKSV